MGFKKKNNTSILSSESFYNSIAVDYNAYMSESDREVRKLVAQSLRSVCPAGTVLDFGGGTGLDLDWLSQNHRVIFLEPSSAMRAVARSCRPIGDILFVEERLSFESWQQHHLPFNEKADVILMNFAVLNCIDNIALLFKKLSLVSHIQTHILATVLNPSPLYLLKNHPGLLATRLFGKPVLQNNYKGVSHAALLHSATELKKAALPFFKRISLNPIKRSPFSLLILQSNHLDQPATV